MKIAVIGAGIVGITSAYELASDGHEVTVFERNSMAAEDASFANAGLLAPSLILPLSLPAWPSASLMGALRRQSRLELKGMPSLRQLQWLWKWHRPPVAEKFLAQRNTALQLSNYSLTRLHQITSDLSLEYERSDGHLLSLQSEAELHALQPLLNHLGENGVVAKCISPEDARRIEPALSPDAPLHSAIYLPGDEVGNCRQFALLLKGAALRLGVQFQFGTTVSQIETGPHISLHVEDASTPFSFDAVAICAGHASKKLLTPLGLRLPLATTYGYTVSTAIGEPLNAPKSAVTDIQRSVSITRLGNRVRVSGGAEFGGKIDDKNKDSLQDLYKVLQQYFPGAARYPSGTQVWKGSRTLSPDGLPVIGLSPVPGVWLNLGHGANGWGMSCGAARILADLMQQQNPDIAVPDVAPNRWFS